MKDSKDSKTTPVRKEDNNVPSYDIIKGLDRSFVETVELLADVNARIKDLQAQADTLKAEGVKRLVKAGVKTVMVGDLRVTRSEGVSSKLDKEKLFKLGGKKVMDWYEKATVKTPWTSLLVTPPKVKEEA